MMATKIQILKCNANKLIARSPTPSQEKISIVMQMNQDHSAPEIQPIMQFTKESVQLTQTISTALRSTRLPNVLQMRLDNTFKVTSYGLPITRSMRSGITSRHMTTGGSHHQPRRKSLSQSSINKILPTTLQTKLNLRMRKKLMIKMLLLRLLKRSLLQFKLTTRGSWQISDRYRKSCGICLSKVKYFNSQNDQICLENIIKSIK